MDLISAIKSGRPFRRKSWNNYREPFERTPGYNAVTFELADLLADDWETKPEPREWWVVLEDGCILAWTTASAEALKSSCSPGRTVVHVREVVE